MWKFFFKQKKNGKKKQRMWKFFFKQKKNGKKKQ
jgi:hypothetical protein